ncbi:MAG: putative peptidoglycan glycosyltransferase FtsW [bacterium]|nr:putative peptidoglycan glycosyltransferase FtsW [bacterium]
MARSKSHRPDYFLLAVLFILTAGGLVILASASSELGVSKFGDSYYYLKHQLINGLLLGIFGFAAAYMLRYTLYKKWAALFLFLNLILISLVFTKFGVTAGGASRWLHLGPVVFQPAELLKISFIVYLAAWFSAGGKSNRGQNFYDGFVPFLVICGVTAGLLVFQPATSTVAILLLAASGMYFVSGARLRYLALSFAVSIVGLAILIYFTPYRMARVVSFFRPDSDSQGSNYHRNQALIALGSGGVTGVGYGKSTAKESYLPAVVDDSIFAVLGQEFGFIGTATFVTLFGMLVFRLLWLANRTGERFGKLILVGFAIIIGLQSLVNMGAISGLIPLTGVPLPFVSYGGTALAVFLTMGGIAANISKYS